MRTEGAKRSKSRGSVLLHVLVTGVVIAVLAAALLNMSMARYAMAGRGAKILQEKRDDTGALAAILATWNTANKVCGGPPPGWGGCLNGAPIPGACNCTCTRPDGLQITTVPCIGLNNPVPGCVTGVCRLSIQSIDIQ